MARARQARRSSRGDHTDAHRRAWRSIMVTQGMITPLLAEDLRSRTGVDLQTYDALLHTYEAGEDGIRMGELASRIVLSRPGLTSLVDRLERDGLLRRVPDPADRRAVRITLTERGTRLFREAARVHVAGITERFAPFLSEDEALGLAELLERVQERARAAAEATDDP